MRGLVVFLFALVVMILFSPAAANKDNIFNKKIEGKEESKALVVSTFTSAVCENNVDYTHCKDELFVNCNGKIYQADEMENCNGFKINDSKVSGFAIFEKGWKDPRT